MNTTQTQMNDGKIIMTEKSYEMTADTLQGLYNIERELEEMPNREHSLTKAILIGRAIAEVQAKIDEWEARI